MAGMACPIFHEFGCAAAAWREVGGAMHDRRSSSVAMDVRDAVV